MSPLNLFPGRLLPALALGALLTALPFAVDAADNDDETQKLVEAYNEDGLDLFDRMTNAGDGNLVLSPYSIGTALAMAYAGAGGDTQAEMVKVLRYPATPEAIGPVNQRLEAAIRTPAEGEDATIAIANALHLTQHGDVVADTYKALLSKDFGAELFAGSNLEAINAWVRDKTGGKIDKILTELDPLSVAVLLNAIHFKAGWDVPFDASATAPGDFHLMSGETIAVPVMHQTLALRYVRAYAYDAVALPYAGGRLEMVLYIPVPGDEHGGVSNGHFGVGLDKVLPLLDAAAPKRVDFSMPKFTFETGTSLIAALKALGLNLPFDADHADFSGVTGSTSDTDRIHISQAEHKALIEVNEAGTEAAAATAIEFALKSAAPERLDEVAVDRPFLFAIRDRSSGALLFAGRVTDPRASSETANTADASNEPDADEPGLLDQLLKPLIGSTAEAPRDAMMSPGVAASMPSPAYRASGGMPGEGDAFQTFADGRTLTVAAEPVSTFSVDVDTAAYSYVRRMLEDGGLPQADAVRLEEMINYFDYGYRGPDSLDTPFAVDTSLFPTPWRDGTQLLRIGIQGYRVPAEDRPPANIVLLVDTSGSMDEPDKLPLLKKSFELLLGQLTDKDTVAIVAYAGSAGIVLEPTPASDKVKIRSALGDLTPGGSTAGAEGIELAYDLAAEAKSANGTNRVILATDGDFNVGIDDPDQLKRFIAKKRDSGIFLSVLGFGTGNLDDATMQALAQNGNGNAAYIDSFGEARKVLAAEIGASLQTIARDVKIQVEFNPARVLEYRLIGYETRILNQEDFNNDAVDAGDIGSGHSVTALYEITPVGSSAALNDPLRYGDKVSAPADTSGELAFVKLRYKPGSADESQLITLPVLAGSAVESIAAAPESARFAAAVAAFGQKLRDNPALAGWDWAAVKALANSARGADENGYRAEMVRLIDLASSLDVN